MSYDFVSWDKGKTERIQTQFLKQALGCNFQTSNNMARADTNTRPLINTIIKRYLWYTIPLQTKKSEISYDAYIFELENYTQPNFCSFTENFNLLVTEWVGKSKHEINKSCNDNYDRYWTNRISESTKAISFARFKTRTSFEPHLAVNFNVNHKKAISRFRLSNHPLMIEKGRHLKIERNERKCPFCKDDIEDEKHFLINCPLYSKERKTIEKVYINNCARYANFDPEQKFIFLITNKNIDIIKTIGKFIYDSLNFRNRLIEYFFS